MIRSCTAGPGSCGFYDECDDVMIIAGKKCGREMGTNMPVSGV